MCDTTRLCHWDAVLFDATGTLIYPHPSVGAVYASVAAEHGYQTTPEALEAAFHIAWKERAPQRFADRPASRTSDPAEKAWWRATVRRNFQLAGLLPPDDACFEAIFARFGRAESWRLFPDAMPTLHALRRAGSSVGIVSNFDSRLERICDGLGLTEAVAFIVYSAAVGSAKPAREIFEAAVRAAGASAARTLVVGDSLETDVAGARAAGCHALLLDRHAAGPEPDTIHSLTDILGLQ